MPRKPIIVSTADPYHVTARCLNREWFGLPLEQVWTITSDYLHLVRQMYQLKIHSFVLMPNHFHLLVRAPEGNLSRAMLYFMRETSREFSRRAGRINQTYGTRHHKSLISNLHYYANAYKYVYRNLVRANLSPTVESYRYSTIAGLCGQTRMTIPLEEDTLLFSPGFDESTLQWLNTEPKRSHESEVRNALRRTKFELVADPETGRPSTLELARL